MIGVQCHWWFLGDTLGYLKVHFNNFCDQRFYEKIDVKVKSYEFFIFSGPIWKSRKWVRRSKLIWEVNLNMVYGIPMWKPENFYMGGHQLHFCCKFFCKKNITVHGIEGFELFLTNYVYYDIIWPKDPFCSYLTHGPPAVCLPGPKKWEILKCIKVNILMYLLML